MSQRITIESDFDLTNTGIVRNFKPGFVPAKVHGRMIETEEQWVKCRRQQANWETVVQTISLRAQPLDISTTKQGSHWIISFYIEADYIYTKDDDPIGLLKDDFENLPLLTGLDETGSVGQYVIARGENQNMRFTSHEI